MKNKYLTIKKISNIYSFKTFWAIKKERDESNASIFFWSLIYAICFLTLFYLFIPTSTGQYHNYLKILFIVLGALCVFRIFFNYLQSIITYPLYINWIKRMPFKISGWPDLFNYDGFNNHEVWIKKCTLSVSCKQCSDYHKKTLHSSLISFCKNANRTCANYHDDNLIAWGNTHNSISGSCNRKIIGKLYRYITIDLMKIQGMTHIIDTINIRIDNNVVNASEIETANSAAST